MDFTNHRYARQLSTTVGNKVTTTVTTVSSTDERYRRTDALYLELSDLVNDQYRAWYCREFHKLGADQVYKLAAKARQEAQHNQARYFSWLLKNPSVA